MMMMMMMMIIILIITIIILTTLGSQGTKGKKIKIKYNNNNYCV